MARANIIIEIYCLLITIALHICNIFVTRNIPQRRRDRYLGIMIYVNAAILVCYTIYLFVDGMPQYAFINNFFSGLCYAGGAVLTALFIEYVYSIVLETRKASSTFVHIIIGLCTIAVAFDIVSIFNGIYFYTANGFHVRGPYYMINQVFIFLLLLLEIIYIIVQRKALKRDMFSLIIYIFIPALATIGQIFVSNYNLLYPATTLSLVVVYIVISINQSSEMSKKNEDLKKAMSDMNAAKKVAETANHSKTDFLSSMSHDIRTPLNAIVGMTNIAIENLDNKKEALENLQVVQQSAKHLLSLINDVLDMSMIENGVIKINLKEFALADVLEESLKIVWHLAYAHKQNLIFDASNVKDEFYIGDNPRIKQIVINLLSNAIKYTQTSGEIRLIVEEIPGVDPNVPTIKISCIDNGIGIAKDAQERIFKPFVREIKTASNPIEGTGLGLAIVKQIVDAMNGTIMVNSQKGKGSEFVVTLPLALADEKKMLASYEDVRNESLLVVSDHPEEFMIVGLHTYDLITTDEIMSQTYNPSKTYQAIICDSEKKSITLVRKIREVYPAAILIWHGNFAEEEHEKEIMECGADAIIYGTIIRSYLYKEYQRLQATKALLSNDLYLHGKNVLVVEDQVINALIIEHLLKNAGASVWKAENGLEAVDMFLNSIEGQFDLIMMDIMMPVMDGHTAATKIRTANRSDAKTVPIVAMTANVYEDDVQKSKAEGMNAHLSKPIDPALLKETITYLLTNQSTSARKG